LVTDALSKFNTVRLPWQPASNNNHDDIYSAVIMTEVVIASSLGSSGNVEQRQAAADPQTKPSDLGCESTCF